MDQKKKGFTNRLNLIEMIDVAKLRRPLFEIRRLDLFVSPHEGNWRLLLKEIQTFLIENCSNFLLFTSSCCFKFDGKLGVHNDDDNVLDDEYDEHDDANDSKLGKQTVQACPWPH